MTNLLKKFAYLSPFILFPTLALAYDEPESFVDIFRNLTSLGGDLAQFFQTIALMGGIILLLTAYIKYKKKRGKPQKPLTPIIMLFAIGLVAVSMYFIPTSDNGHMQLKPLLIAPTN